MVNIRVAIVLVALLCSQGAAFARTSVYSSSAGRYELRYPSGWRAVTGARELEPRMKRVVQMKVGVVGLCRFLLVAGCASPSPPHPRAPVSQPRSTAPRQQPVPVSRPAPRPAPPPAPVDEGCGECRRLGAKCSTCGWIEVWTGFLMVAGMDYVGS
jgi:hypothetical protein